MGGFPTREPRTAFGPTMENASPVRNPKRHLDAAKLNLSNWQVAGMNLVSPRLVVLAAVDVATPAVTTLVQKAAWDPDGAMGAVSWVRSAAGVYTWALTAGSYADMDGNLVAVAPMFSVAVPLTVGAAAGAQLVPWSEVPGSAGGNVKFRTNDDSGYDDPQGAAPTTDAALALLVW